MKFYKRFPGDITIKTGDLTLVEFGAYDRLLDHYYATEAPIEPHRVYSVARCQTAAERRAVDMVLAKFWKLTDSGWVQERADEMIAEALPRIEAAKQNGKLGGRPKGPGKKPIQEPAGFSDGTPPVEAGIASQSQNQNGSEAKASAAAGAAAAVDKSTTPEPTMRERSRAWLLRHGLDEGRANTLLNTVAKDCGSTIAAAVFSEAIKGDPVGDTWSFVEGIAKRLKAQQPSATVPSDEAEKTAAYLAQQAAERAAIAGRPVPDSVREAAARLKAQAASAPAPAQEGAAA